MKDSAAESKITFSSLGIDDKLLKILEKLNFKTPTPIQHKAIPAGISGTDMVGIAQTGTGKTIAFLIPMIQRLSASKGKGLVLVPTRELAVQVADVAEDFSSFTGSGTATLIGGENIDNQFRQLAEKPRIIIATPGRLLDHLEQKTVNLSDTEILVLDEADRMFDMGFAPQIERVISYLPVERQTMLFSATMPEDVMKLASRHMKMPVRIEVARAGSAPQQVEQELFFVDNSSKLSLLNSILEKYTGTVLLFVRTRHHARQITSALRALKHNAAEIHSDRSLGQRMEAMEGFKSGKYRILVATDIAARGIDVTGIELVINYDLPDEEENYVHRIGRTGRAGRMGHAITFASPDQMKDISRIENLIKMRIKSSALPPLRPLRRLKNENSAHGKPYKEFSDDNGRERTKGRGLRDSKKRFGNSFHPASGEEGRNRAFNGPSHYDGKKRYFKGHGSPSKLQAGHDKKAAYHHGKSAEASSPKSGAHKKRGIIRSFIRRIMGKKDED